MGGRPGQRQRIRYLFPGGVRRAAVAYDFDLVQDRRNTGSVKWDVPQGALPMSLADMDFQAAPEILEAFRRRVDNGIFGYGMIPDTWHAAYQGW